MINWLRSAFPVLLLLAAFLHPVGAAPLPAPGDDPTLKRYEKYDRGDFKKDVGKAEMLTQHLPIGDVLGPLAPLALSPFFALTILSGASIMVDNEYLPKNDFLYGNPVLGNEWVFFVLLALTVFTSLPRFTKVSKAVAQAADFLETNAAIIIYLMILAIAVAPSQESGPRIVYHAGIFEFTSTTLLMAFCVVNIVVINTIRFFFELMVFLCPVPAVDAVFEICNKLFALALAVAYVFNPWLAAVFDLLLFAVCLLGYAIVRRRLSHYRAILVDPVLAGIRGMFVRDTLPARHRTILAMVEGKFETPPDAVVVKVFTDTAFGPLKKRSKCYLVQTVEGPVLVKPRLIGGPLLQKIGPAAGQTLFLRPGLLQNAVVVRDPAGQVVVKLLFTRAWSNYLDRVIAAFDAYLEEPANAGLLKKTFAAGRQSLMDLGRGLANSVSVKGLPGPAGQGAV
jgi:hypothetical protein